MLLARGEDDGHGDRAWISTPSLIPGAGPMPMMPHPYFGVIFLWMTPGFPEDQHADQRDAGVRRRRDGLLGAHPAGRPDAADDAEQGVLAAVPAEHSRRR